MAHQSSPCSDQIWNTYLELRLEWDASSLPKFIWAETTLVKAYTLLEVIVLPLFCFGREFLFDKHAGINLIKTCYRLDGGRNLSQCWFVSSFLAFIWLELKNQKRNWFFFREYQFSCDCTKGNKPLIKFCLAAYLKNFISSDSENLIICCSFFL